MKCTVTKWGNSYAIRIPKQIVDEYNLENQTLDITHDRNKITLKKPTKEAELDALLEHMKPQEEIDWGDARGREVW